VCVHKETDKTKAPPGGGKPGEALMSGRRCSAPDNSLGLIYSTT
jgi:hypothetical protein